MPRKRKLFQFLTTVSLNTPESGNVRWANREKPNGQEIGFAVSLTKSETTLILINSKPKFGLNVQRRTGAAAILQPFRQSKKTLAYPE